MSGLTPPRRVALVSLDSAGGPFVEVVLMEVQGMDAERNLTPDTRNHLRLSGLVGESFLIPLTELSTLIDNNLRRTL